MGNEIKEAVERHNKAKAKAEGILVELDLNEADENILETVVNKMANDLRDGLSFPIGADQLDGILVYIREVLFLETANF